MDKVGIVLLNMGGPKDLESVNPFLFKLFSDPELIKLPFFIRPAQKLIAKLIAKSRSSGTKSMYEQIGGGSPIRQITESLSSKIEKELVFQGYDVSSVVCMRYSDPYAKQAVNILEEHKPDKILLFSQYPHYAESTTKSSFNDFYKHAKKSSLNGVKYKEIEDWGEEEEYLNWWITGIKNIINNLSQEEKSNLHILFSAHGLPMRYIKQGEKYPERIESAVNKIVQQLQKYDFKWHLSFQSRAGPVEWTRPYTDHKIEEIAEQSPSTLIMVPIGFVSNHVETLYEIDILYGDLAKKLQITNYLRVEVPDDDDEYSKAISKMLVRYLEEP